MALKSKILDFDEITDILTELGVRAGRGEEIPLDLWCGPKRLSAEQLESFLETMEPVDPAVCETSTGLDELTLPDDDGPVHTQELFGSADTALVEPSTMESVATVGEEPSVIPEVELGSGSTDLFADVSTATIEVKEEDQATLRRSDSSQQAIAVGQTLQDLDVDLAFDKTGLYEPVAKISDSVEREDRYQLGRQLGRGGGGRVLEVYDKVLKRRVAMKLLEVTEEEDEHSVRRFLAEAQASCQLEHPNIISVYDVGIRPGGQLYYTMLKVEQHSLEDVLEGLRGGDEEYRDEYTLPRLLTIFNQVLQAIDYAHDRGGIHRDLKPSNIMIGEFGEVLVMDWGLAYVRGGGVKTEFSELGEDIVDEGQTLGTPSYMPPEQARGALDEVDERSDIYALGAVLYEILTLRPPFERESPVQTMWSVIESDIVEPSQCVEHQLWEVATTLEELCMKALARDKDKRFASAGEFFEAIEQFLGGMRARQALRYVDDGRQSVERYLECTAEITALNQKIGKYRETIEPWESIGSKRKLWRLEDRRETLLADRAREFGEAILGFQKALTHDGQCEAARRELVDLYWERYCEAEEAGNEFEKIYFRACIREVSQQAYKERLASKVKVTFRTRPEAAQVTLFPLEEIDRRLVVSDERSLGDTPVNDCLLEVGRYLAVFEAPDKAVVRAPLEVRRGEKLNMRVFLPPAESSSPEFAFIPGGPCVIGGDFDAINPRARTRLEVRSFYMACLPVTFRQYLEFLDDLSDEKAHRHAPRGPGDQGLLVERDEASGKWTPRPFLSETLIEKTHLQVRDFYWSLPVVGIRGADTLAYCEWRSARDGRNYRLPTETEWEMAGRGADGRLYSWGDRFDATFCKMQQSRAHISQLEPVGRFVDDVSPYGICDLSGGVHEWCAPAEDDQRRWAIRGGAWNQGERACRLASIRRIPANRRALNIGMRLVYDVAVDDGWSGTKIVAIPES